MRKVTLLAMIVVIMGCTYNHTYNVMTGLLTGRIVDSLSNPIPNVYLEVKGARWTYVNDDSGKFAVAGLYDGSFILNIQASGYRDTAISFSILNEETVDLGLIRLKKAPILLNNTEVRFSFGSVNFYDSYSISDSFLMCSDTLGMTIWANVKNAPFKVTLDNAIIANGIIRKQDFTFSFPISNGIHQLKIIDNQDIIKNFLIYNAMKTSTFICISSARYVSYTPDLDLILINDHGDTCSYRHPLPLWGNKDSIFENPQYKEDNSFSRNESIVLAHPKDGIYKLYAHNYYDTISTSSPETFRPSYTLTLGDTSRILFAPKSLIPNDLWFIGTITVPQMTFTPKDSISTVYYP